MNLDASYSFLLLRKYSSTAIIFQTLHSSELNQSSPVSAVISGLSKTTTETLPLVKGSLGLGSQCSWLETRAAGFTLRLHTKMQSVSRVFCLCQTWHSGARMCHRPLTFSSLSLRSKPIYFYRVFLGRGSGGQSCLEVQAKQRKRYWGGQMVHDGV